MRPAKVRHPCGPAEYCALLYGQTGRPEMSYTERMHLFHSVPSSRPGCLEFTTIYDILTAFWANGQDMAWREHTQMEPWSSQLCVTGSLSTKSAAGWVLE